MRSLSYLGILALLLLAGCALVDDNTPPEADGDDATLQPLDRPGDVIVLAEGEQATLAAYNATLTFVEKKEDSRCPINVTCVWEGRADVRMMFARDGQAATSFALVGFVGPDGYEAGSPPRVFHEVQGFRFTLERLDPYPEDGAEQTPTPAATIRVEAL